MKASASPQSRAKTFKKEEEGARRKPRFFIAIMKQSLCQTCFNYRDCPWHERFEPRDDWKATATSIVMKFNARNVVKVVASYNVRVCPQYATRGGWLESGVREIGGMLGVNFTTVIKQHQRGTLGKRLAAIGWEYKVEKPDDESRYNHYYIRRTKQ